MKMLFVTSTYLPVVNGVSYQIKILKKGLEDLGHNVFIFAPYFPGYSDSDETIIRYPSLPNPFIKKHPIGIPVFQMAKIQKIKPDIIHTHNPLIFGWFAQQISERFSIPLFLTFHTKYEEYANYYFPIFKNLSGKLINNDLRRLSRKCYKVVCPSHQAEETLKSYGLRNTVIINNAVEDDFLEKPQKKSLENLSLVFTGRLEKEKNLFFLLKIANELKKINPNFKLLIIGDGSQLSPLIRQTREDHLEKNVIFPGIIDRSLLPEIYKKVHLFITPSLTEVMPLTLIEALAKGIPVLALEESRLEDIIIDNKTGYLLEPNPELFAQKIVEILTSPEQYKKLAINAYKHALNFRVSKKAKEHENLYSEALGFRGF